jgi:type IV pilus assembly protein PilO
MTTPRTSHWRESLASVLTWYWAGVVILLALAISLSVRLVLDWSFTQARFASTLAAKQTELKSLQLETAPLRGLDKQVDRARTQIRDFYQNRMPSSYSSISTRIGALQVASGVRLSRVQYTQGTPVSDLTEITMDAGISGDYPAIMRFINSLERDEMFFVIRAMSLTGQQGGQVSLRLRLSTWLRAADAAASGLPATPKETSPAADQSGAKESE